MDIFGLILLVIVLSLLGGAGYFAYDYIQHKKEVDTEFDNTKKKIEGTESAVEKEGETRMSNLKYMVGEINKVHDDIYTTLEKRVDEQKEIIAAVKTDQGNLVTGMGSLFKIEASPLSGTTTSATSTTSNTTSTTSNTTSTTSNTTSKTNSMSILDLPGNPTANVQLLKHVTTVSGLTARDLNVKNGVVNAVKLCGAGQNPRCIQFPDENGNTYITPLSTGKAVVMDGVTEFKNKLVLKGSGHIESPNAPIILDADMGVYATDIGTNAAYVVGDGRRSLLTVAKFTNDGFAEALRIDATGKLVLPDNNTIQVENKKLVVNAPNGMEVRGKMNVVGDAFINNKEISITRFSDKTF